MLVDKDILKEERRKVMTQVEFANACNVSENTMSQREQGKWEWRNVKDIKLAFEALGLNKERRIEILDELLTPDADETQLKVYCEKCQSFDCEHAKAKQI